MAENPLLPHRRLQELHALMLRCRELERGQRPAPKVAREALLSATAIQMEPGDLLFGEAGDSTVLELAPRSASAAPKKRKVSPPEEHAAPEGLSRLTLAAGMAQALRAAGSKHAVVALASAGAFEESWEEALTYAQKARLPLLLLCVDTGATRKPRSGSSPLVESAVTRLCKKIFLPTLTVDGEDAVAVYRVMQESFLRARMGDGPAVIWCLLPQRSSRGGSRPIANMERYLAARGLKPQKRR